jgi:DNA topoisomerase I
MGKSLVIVESPSKAKTINKYLGKDYIVEATVGHIKNLPKNKIHIDLDNGYEPTYETIAGKEKVIKRIKELAGECLQVYIATDPDREGEAIAYDIAEEVKLVNKKIKRVLFNEITKHGVEIAMNEPLDIDDKLVESQTARRVMDRILGYKVSPFLWKSMFYGLSAGRVQSVALKLICDREEEIKRFKPKEYWSVFGTFVKPSGATRPFNSKLYSINSETIKYNGDEPCIKNIDEAHAIIEQLRECKYRIADIQKREVKRNAPLPFTTSVLQQTASTKLGYNPKRTMSLAQKLYEGVEVKKGEGNIGLITYMRTDSTRISNEAKQMANDLIVKLYGQEYVSTLETANGKKAVKAQDAHEAIRPSDVNIRPEDLKKLDKSLLALYTLIWQRFVASQMSAAVFTQKTILIKAISPKGNIKDYLFKATGRTPVFLGFLKIYEEELEETVDNEEEGLLPEDLNVNDMLKLVGNMQKIQHFTNPPPRFTESSLIKQLDTLGIGRPSTFAQIVSTVIDRKYVDLNERRLFATQLGIQVNKILQEYFPDVISTQFTAKMEEELDTIANGESTYVEVLNDFYFPFKKDLDIADKDAPKIKKSLTEPTKIKCPECGDTEGGIMLKKWGKNGLFYACNRYPKCKGTLSHEDNEPVEQTPVGDLKCPKCKGDMLLKIGPYGKFYGCINYPKCNGILPVTLGIKCPKCGKGEILERVGGKRRRKFYGCTGYPDCDFIENYLPVIENCNSCGNNYLVKKSTQKDGDFLYCAKCKHKEMLKTEHA